MQAARLQKIDTESTDPLRLQASKDEVSRLRVSATLQQEIASATQERDQGPAKMEAMASTGPNEEDLRSKGPNVADLMSQITKLEEVCLCLHARTLVRMSSGKALPCKHITHACMYTYIQMHVCMHAFIGTNTHE